jgi:tetrahydromethanopterin S-methyltransferase subunit E
VRSLLFLALLLPASASAETWITVTTASLHYGTDKKYEQQNWGIGIEQGMSETVRVVGGMYRNSNRRDSIYFGLSWHPWRLWNLRLGLGAMFVGGYETAKSPELVKAAFPVITYEAKSWGINVPIIPAVNSQPGAVGLQLKFKW